MRNTMRTLCAAMALTCSMAFPAFAAETKAEYKTEATSAKEELKSLNETAKSLRLENKTSSAAYKAEKTARKNGGEGSVNKENWKKARELRKEITAIHVEMKSTGTVKALRSEIKAHVKAGQYDSALEKLNKVVEIKKERLESLEKANDIWDQIDALLQ